VWVLQRICSILCRFGFVSNACKDHDLKNDKKSNFDLGSVYSKKEKPAPGDIMKAVIRPGEAGVNPKTGDQV
jgi:hypothetical protein